MNAPAIVVPAAKIAVEINVEPELAQQGCQSHLVEIAARRRAEQPARLAELANLIRVELRAGVEHAVRAGALLIDAKRVVDHGQWLPWLSENFGLSERSAQNFMKLSRDMAALPEANAKRVALLPLREALASIAESRQPEVQSGKKTAPKPPAKITPKTDTKARKIEDQAGDDGAGGADHGDVDDAEPEPRRTKRQSRGQRWADAAGRAAEAVQELIDIQAEYQEWREGLPENLAGGAVAEKLDTVVGIDLEGALSTLTEAADADLPLGFGRD